VEVCTDGHQRMTDIVFVFELIIRDFPGNKTERWKLARRRDARACHARATDRFIADNEKPSALILAYFCRVPWHPLPSLPPSPRVTHAARRQGTCYLQQSRINTRLFRRVTALQIYDARRDPRHRRLPVYGRVQQIRHNTIDYAG